MVRTKLQKENQQRAITSLLIETYPHITFQSNISYTLRVMVPTNINYENQQRTITKKI